MSGLRSRRKGQRFERYIANELKDKLGLDTKRGFQTRGGGEEQPDVVGVPGVHPELKHHKKVNYRAALRQAESDAKDGLIPIVIAKDDQEDPVVYMRWSDFRDHFLDAFSSSYSNRHASFEDTELGGKIVRTAQQLGKLLDELHMCTGGDSKAAK